MGYTAFSINGKDYGSGSCLIIAELGTAHGADLVKAKELIDAAAESGALCIKFQLVYAHEILHPNTGLVQLPGGAVPLYERFKALEVPLDFFIHIKEYVESKGLLFLCTPFGPRSLKDLLNLGVSALKIASPELNYVQLVQDAASAGLPTLLSSGVSTLADIESALEYFKPGQACLLHCVTSYPAPEKDYNLLSLKSLQAIFGVPLGVSDHTMDPVLIPSLACALGASVVEKHFCLSRSDQGLDDPIALTPQDFSAMVKAIHGAEKLHVELGSEGAVAALAQEYGEDRVRAALGDGVKRLAPSEKENYTRTNRSLHALRDLQEGEIIRQEDIGVLRTEKVLRPGLAPRFLEQVIGHRARFSIPAGEGIRFEDI